MSLRKKCELCSGYYTQRGMGRHLNLSHLVLSPRQKEDQRKYLERRSNHV